MKTFLIVSEKRYNDHVDEYYDDFIEVDDEVISHHGPDNYGPHLTPIAEWHNRIRGRIRKIWSEDESEDKCVSIYLDAAAPFNAMLIDLQIVMGKEEGIKIELPYLDGRDLFRTEDSEANALIERLNNRP